MNGFRFRTISEDTRQRPEAIRRLYESWVEVTAREFRQHLVSLGDEANGARITLRVLEFGMKNRRMMGIPSCHRSLKVRIHGSFAGRRMDVTVEAEKDQELRIATKRNAGAGLTMVGDPKLRFMVRDIARRPNGDLTMSHRQIGNEPFFANFNLKLMEAFDGDTGRTEVPIGQQWRMMQWVIRAATMLCLVCMTVFFMMQIASSPKGTLGIANSVLCVCFSMMPASLVWLFSYSVCASLMPAEFLTTHGAGKRIMKFVGTTNPRTAKVILLVAVVFLLMIFAAIVGLSIKPF